jgi:hypothetical protein
MSGSHRRLPLYEDLKLRKEEEEKRESTISMDEVLAE